MYGPCSSCLWLSGNSCPRLPSSMYPLSVLFFRTAAHCPLPHCRAPPGSSCGRLLPWSALAAPQSEASFTLLLLLHRSRTQGKVLKNVRKSLVLGRSCRRSSPDEKPHQLDTERVGCCQRHCGLFNRTPSCFP